MKDFSKRKKLSPVAELERDFYAALQGYEVNAQYRPTPAESAENMIARMAESMRQVSAAAAALASGLEEHGGFDMPRSQLARDAWYLGDALRNRADVVDDEPDKPILRSDGKPYTYKEGAKARTLTTHLWCRVMVDAAEKTSMDIQARRIQAAIHIAQVKANLLVAFDACKLLYNAYKPRKPRPTASGATQDRYRDAIRANRQMAIDLLVKMLPHVYPAGWLTPKFRKVTIDALEPVLADRGKAHAQPCEAIVPVVCSALNKYMRPYKVTPDFVRQGASYLYDGARPSPEILSIIQREQTKLGIGLRTVRKN